MSTATTAPSSPSWLDDEVCLADGVELLEGADDQPMLFDPKHGTYVRVSRSAIRLVSLLDGSRSGRELVEGLRRRRGGDGDAVAAAVERFLEELRAARMLTADPADERLPQEIARRSGGPMLKRFPLAHDLQGLLTGLSRLLAHVPQRRLRLGLVALLAAAAALVIAAVVSLNLRPQTVHVPIVFGLFVVQIIAHELAHALECERKGCPVRDAGIGLLFYIIPVAYVDRTDTYRLRRRWDRAAVALAGPVNDLLWAGMTAIVALAAGGAVAHVASLLLVVQGLLLLGNLNVLLPTDGYNALEALTGEFNYRSRAFSYLGHRVTRQELPSALEGTSAGRRAGYLVFSACCVAYLLLCVGFGALVAAQLIS